MFTYYLPIIHLKEKHLYRIVRTVERDDNILLYLREYEDTREFISLLLPRSFHQTFKRVKQLNIEMNGETSVLKLKYYGYSCFNSGKPILRISGRGFTTYFRFTPSARNLNNGVVNKRNKNNYSWDLLGNHAYKRYAFYRLHLPAR